MAGLTKGKGNGSCLAATAVFGLPAGFICGPAGALPQAERHRTIMAPQPEFMIGCIDSVCGVPPSAAQVYASCINGRFGINCGSSFVSQSIAPLKPADIRAVHP